MTTDLPNHILLCHVEILRLREALSEFKALKDRLDNGIKYDEELNCYTVRWTANELEQAQKDANRFYNELNWCEPYILDSTDD